MFQLIVAVISIALVAALAFAAIWYGGSTFSENGDKAIYAQYMNEGVQISGALKVHEAMTGVAPTSFTDEGTTGTTDPIYNFDKLKTMELIKDTDLGDRAKDPWIISKGEVRRLMDMRSFDETQALARCAKFNKYAGKEDKTAGIDSCPPCSDEAHKDFPACRSTN